MAGDSFLILAPHDSLIQVTAHTVKSRSTTGGYVGIHKQPDVEGQEYRK